LDKTNGKSQIRNWKWAVTERNSELLLISAHFPKTEKNIANLNAKTLWTWRDRNCAPLSSIPPFEVHIKLIKRIKFQFRCKDSWKTNELVASLQWTAGRFSTSSSSAIWTATRRWWNCLNRWNTNNNMMNNGFFTVKKNKINNVNTTRIIDRHYENLNPIKIIGRNYHLPWNQENIS